MLLLSVKFHGAYDVIRQAGMRRVRWILLFCCMFALLVQIEKKLVEMERIVESFEHGLHP